MQNTQEYLGSEVEYVEGNLTDLRVLEMSAELSAAHLQTQEPIKCLQGWLGHIKGALTRLNKIADDEVTRQNIPLDKMQQYRELSVNLCHFVEALTKEQQKWFSKIDKQLMQRLSLEQLQQTAGVASIPGGGTQAQERNSDQYEEYENSERSDDS